MAISNQSPGRLNPVQPMSLPGLADVGTHLHPHPGPLQLIYLFSVNLPLKSPLPFKGRVGVGMGQFRCPKTPIPLLASPLKGEGPEQRRISASQVNLTSVLISRTPHKPPLPLWESAREMGEMRRLQGQI
ncbi:MAG: hypothetical protein A2075_21025 [Geobacteraceae bacterium GWC2_58_44]|nr:MAG: hypothetical protein A2075_21025 [Geobacteraceae bacterium GWC2_58_44]